MPKIKAAFFREWLIGGGTGFGTDFFIRLTPQIADIDSANCGLASHTLSDATVVLLHFLRARETHTPCNRTLWLCMMTSRRDRIGLLYPGASVKVLFDYSSTVQ